jgi:GGDEF domain-containing protein
VLVRVLFVEDVETDAELAVRRLRSDGVRAGNSRRACRRVGGRRRRAAQDRDAITGEELKLLGEVAANLSFALQYFEKESAVQFLSYFDSLTGLAKRVLFCERLATRLTARKAEEPQPAVAVIDIEHLRGS